MSNSKKSKVRKVLSASGKTSISKSKITKAVKQIVTEKKKAPIKIKRIEEPSDIVEDNSIESNQSTNAFTKKVQTKLVVKDGMVIVEPIHNPFDD